MDNQLIQQLHDKQSITEVLLTYTRAIDTLDENLLRSVFHSDSEHNHTFVGPSSNPNLPSTATEPGDFVAYALNFLKRFVKTHHQLGPPLITVAGHHAQSECYFTATHLLPSETDQSAQATAQEPKTEWSVGGRYVDELEKRDDVWKIRRRTGFADWRRTK
jgi:hypothetical protein